MAGRLRNYNKNDTFSININCRTVNRIEQYRCGNFPNRSKSTLNKLFRNSYNFSFIINTDYQNPACGISKRDYNTSDIVTLWQSSFKLNSLRLSLCYDLCYSVRCCIKHIKLSLVEA